MTLLVTQNKKHICNVAFNNVISSRSVQSSLLARPVARVAHFSLYVRNISGEEKKMNFATCPPTDGESIG